MHDFEMKHHIQSESAMVCLLSLFSLIHLSIQAAVAASLPTSSLPSGSSTPAGQALRAAGVGGASLMGGVGGGAGPGGMYHQMVVPAQVSMAHMMRQEVREGKGRRRRREDFSLFE